MCAHVAQAERRASHNLPLDRQGPVLHLVIGPVVGIPGHHSYRRARDAVGWMIDIDNRLANEVLGSWHVGKRVKGYSAVQIRIVGLEYQTQRRCTLILAFPRASSQGLHWPGDCRYQSSIRQ